MPSVFSDRIFVINLWFFIKVSMNSLHPAIEQRESPFTFIAMVLANHEGFTRMYL